MDIITWIDNWFGKQKSLAILSLSLYSLYTREYLFFLRMLTSTFSAHGFELSPEEIELFERFLTLFIEYNSHTNLSAIRDEAGIIEKHFVDSLYGSVAMEAGMSYDGDSPSAENQLTSSPAHQPTFKLLDIWSGWWFPGIPLKITHPEIQVTLLDSVGKKVKAMQHFITELWLEGITAIQERAEVLAKNSEYVGKYDVVVSRATAYITDILTWATPFLAKHGKIILYKMPSDEETKDREKVAKKLGLNLVWEYEYELAGKVRMISIFQKK